LKLLFPQWVNFRFYVTPLAGVWIEILEFEPLILSFFVTPLAGVWIEIFFDKGTFIFWEVTPLAGVWIEISIYNIGSYR